jgi:hypothetical protein
MAACAHKKVGFLFFFVPPQFSYVRWTSFLIVFLLGRWLDGIWCLFLFFIFMFHIELARLVEASLNERWDGMSWRGLLVVVVGGWVIGYAGLGGITMAGMCRTSAVYGNLYRWNGRNGNGVCASGRSLVCLSIFKALWFFWLCTSFVGGGRGGMVFSFPFSFCLVIPFPPAPPELWVAGVDIVG